MQTIRTISCKLSVSEAQAQHIDATLEAFAAACNYIADIGRQTKVSKQFALHKLCYTEVRKQFSLSANLAVRAIARVATALADKKKRNSTFQATSIDYDARIFSFDTRIWVASLTLLNSREKFRLDIGEYQQKALIDKSPTSAQLVKRGKRYFLNIQIKEESPDPKKTKKVLGVDLGIKSIASLSDGTQFSGRSLNTYRLVRHKVRKSLQSKAHKGSQSSRKNARRTLKRLSGKEQRTAKSINHLISKQIVEKAQANSMMIALEDLYAIRERTNKKLRKSQRGLHNTWSFYQLRQFVEYKAARVGVKVVLVNPRYTSQTCSVCLHIGQRNREKFSCANCGSVLNADINGARNIATVGGVVTHPENSAMLSCFLHS